MTQSQKTRSSMPPVRVASEREALQVIQALKIETELRAEHELLKRLFGHHSLTQLLSVSQEEKHDNHLNWQMWEQKLSRYVFADMEQDLKNRALAFAVSIADSDEACLPAIAKIVISRVSKDQEMQTPCTPLIQRFMKLCLNNLIQWEYLGWDTEGAAYNTRRWSIARRVLFLIWRTRDTAFLGQIKTIHDRFSSGAVTCVDGDAFTHAEATGVLAFVVQRLQTVPPSA